MGLILLQNGTPEEVKKIVTTLNEAEVPSEDVVGEFCFELTLIFRICSIIYDVVQIVIFSSLQRLL